MRHAAAVVLLAAAVAHGQQCTYSGGSFTLPNWGTDGNLQQYYQYVPSNPSLTTPRYWQMSLCGTSANTACQSAGKGQSYIYELNRNDGTSGSCDMGLVTLSTPWAQGTWNGQAAMLATFQDASGARVGQVSIICGGSATSLTPVNYPQNTGPNPGWYTFPNAASTVWTWNIVFQYNGLPMCGGPNPNPNPTPNPNPNPNPSPLPPVPTGNSTGSTEEKSSGAAIAFVVLVFVLPVVYVGGMVLYGYFRLQKRGWELAPHPEFWKDFPVLCLDGCRFVKDKFLQLIGKGGGGSTEYSKL